MIDARVAEVPSSSRSSFPLLQGLTILTARVSILAWSRPSPTKETAAIFANERVRRFSGELLRTARRKLAQLSRAVAVEELRIPPGNRLEKLSGNREGQWNIRVNDQWRVCFEWRDGHAWNVEMVDYH